MRVKSIALAGGRTVKIVWLHDPGARDPQLVGTKAASLSALMARYPVPLGFCLTAVSPQEGHLLPPSAATGLQVAYTQLGRRSGSQDPVVAVRSSRLEEDGPAPSQGGAVLHVAGLEAVTEAVQRCLSGPARAHEEQRAVIVQQFVPADLSGVAFSINPITGSRSEMLIQATWGLGGGWSGDESMVDRYRVSRPGLALLESRVGEKRRMSVAVAGGTAEVDVPRLLRGEPTLSEAQVEEIARLLLVLEAEWKQPVEVTFAWEGEQIYLLQCRPALRSETPVEPAAASGPAEGGLPVEAPSEFPVTWPYPEDAQRYWMHDPTLYPDQVLPMFASFFDPWAAAWVRENPHVGCEFRRINTYLYERYFPNPDGPLVGEQPVWTAGQLQSLWQREILPEIQSQCLHLANTDLTAVPRHALGAQLEELVDRYVLIWELHWRIVNPVQATLERYREIYGELFTPTDPLEDLTLLQGFDNKLVEANRELWRLSREIPDNPHLRALFTERPAAEILKALSATRAGEAWLQQFQSYLERFGRRFDLWDWSRPSWREEPTPVIQAVQAFLTVPAYQPVEGASRRAAEREAAEEAARERLAGYPRPVRERFEGCLRAAQIAAVLKEEHDFWIDHWSMYEVRRALQSLGRRFAGTGLIDSEGEIWYLTLHEAREAASGGPIFSLRARVAERREEMARWAGVTPPPHLGTHPARPWRTPASTAPSLPELQGEPCSPGVARGRARVLRRMAEAGKLQPGEILVAPTLTASWSPLFALAAAVVADGGGVLSHGAVAAREFHLPAVLGAAGATRRIRDGEWIEVDGTGGVVRVVEA